MKVKVIVMVVLLCIIIASGCTSDGVVGIYDNMCDLIFPDQYMEIRSDGTFSNHLTLTTPELGYNGTWQVEGESIVLNAVLIPGLPIDISINETWIIEGDSLIDTRGCAWIKR